MDRNKDNHTDSEFYEPYVRFSKILRTWLVSYGVGAIFFLISQNTITAALNTNKPLAKEIIFFIMVGIAIQVLAAILYKYSMGYLYHGDIDKELQESFRYKLASSLSDWLLLELVFDLATIIAYVWATYSLAILVLLKI